MMAPVTTPRWSHATVDCGPTTVHTDSKPSPKPSTNVLVTGIHTGAGSGASRKAETPTRQTPLPITAVRHGHHQRSEDGAAVQGTSRPCRPRRGWGSHVHRSLERPPQASPARATQWCARLGVMSIPFPAPTAPVSSRAEVFLGYLDYF